MEPLTIISILAQFAPTLLKAIGVGSDVQKVANTAAAIATAVTGKADMNDAAAAMQADPALVQQFQQKILEQDTLFEQLYVEDKASARARDIALSSTPRGNVRANWLVAFAILTITACLGIIVFKPIADEFAKSTVILILGMYITELKNIYSFEFGTTRRSREKSDILKEQ